MALNRTLPVPLYYQLAELLAAKIRQGEFAPGQQLPAERELSEQFGISRMTVRQALAYLVAEGTLTTHQRLGTFVAAPGPRKMSKMQRREARAGLLFVLL